MWTSMKFEGFKQDREALIEECVFNFQHIALAINTQEILLNFCFSIFSVGSVLRLIHMSGHLSNHLSE